VNEALSIRWGGNDWHSAVKRRHFDGLRERHAAIEHDFGASIVCE
jgi:hypothetical protein